MHPSGTTAPRTFLFVVPEGARLLCAVFYFEKGRDIYGWWIGARDAEYHSAYFK
jgi:hypothetical protein